MSGPDSPIDIFGHRGAAAEAPENTLFGIRHAIEHGCRNFEIDVRLSADQQLVLSHDATLTRTAGIDKPIGELTAEQLAGIVNPLTVSHSLSQKNEKTARSITEANNHWLTVPTLQNVLQHCPEIDCLQIEVKSDATTDIPQTVAALGKLFDQPASCHNIVVTSFDANVLRQLRDHYPHIPIGLIDKQEVSQAIANAKNLGCNYLCLNKQLIRHQLAKFMPFASGLLPGCHPLWNTIKHCELHISLWTVNEKQLIEKLQRRPVSSVITDYPSRFSALSNT